MLLWGFPSLQGITWLLNFKASAGSPYIISMELSTTPINVIASLYYWCLLNLSISHINFQDGVASYCYDFLNSVFFVFSNNLDEKKPFFDKSHLSIMIKSPAKYIGYESMFYLNPICLMQHLSLTLWTLQEKTTTNFSNCLLNSVPEHIRTPPE